MLDELARLDDGGLLGAMSQSLREERAAAARRMVALGLLTQRRVINANPDRQFWCIDDREALAGEVGAELGISRARASAEMSYGETLVTRLPKLAERFLAGEVDVRVITAIDYRTHNVQDSDLVARLDTMLAEQAPGWNKLSREKLIHVIDWLVINLDPDARRIVRDRNDDRRIEITPDAYQPGMAEVWGRLPAAGGATLDKRLDGLAATVCRDDPRTKAQRRVDALIALSEGATTLTCECGIPDCPAAQADTPDALTQVIIHVIAEEGTIAEQSTDAGNTTVAEHSTGVRQDTPAEQNAEAGVTAAETAGPTETAPVDSAGSKPGYLPGYGPIPAESVRELAKKARLRPLIIPKNPPPEPHYRPSTALAEFIRARDLTCRWVGCNVLAEFCDVDHTIPWPFGATHPSNTKLYCRTHHLMKTFLVGPGGWHELQLPDGTMVWTAPTGRTYVTKPAGSLFFPQLASPTGTLDPSNGSPPTDASKTVMMPLRKRTRAAERAARIEWERGVNRARMLADPPPF
jgi:hypothetical protein